MTNEHIAVRGMRTAQRTGKPHITRVSPAGDSQRFLVSYPKEGMWRGFSISGCRMAAERKTAIQLLSEDWL